MPIAEPRTVLRPSRRLVLAGGALAALTLTSAAEAAPRRAKPAAPEVANKVPLPVVVIDPGHGGRDPGAVGVSGTLEKTVTLAAALELKRQLEATRRYRVKLTRSDDRTVSLPARVAFARAQGAVLLISIHADSAPTAVARGASVYIRAPEAPTRRVPARPKEIARALAGDAEESGWLRRLLIDTLDDDFEMTDHPARDADFYVLRASTMASVLLEMGFLSNRRDEADLRKPKHRAAMARAISEAVDAYFERVGHPPAKRA
jgi:N-acetylmuramoyl-L-alanine amidase